MAVAASKDAKKARKRKARRPSPRGAIAFVGNYPPRRSGIATFTADLCGAVAEQARGRFGVFAVAVNDVPEGYPYSDRVRFEIRQNMEADYRLAASFLNIQLVSAVCLQGEYAVFGGSWGPHVLGLLEDMSRPIVTTLHTVLKDPTDQQRQVLEAICRSSDRLVVMSDIAHETLREVHHVPAEKVVTIPHGIPDVPFMDPDFYKEQFGVGGRKTLLTFGLLSPEKGIEYVIEALPAIIRKYPDIVYIILGVTHPAVKRDSGEEYRNSLALRVRDLGLAEHVIFQNRFVKPPELCEFLGVADMYVSPYVDESQTVSGTLTCALGAGKAVISTPYGYATEMLADGRGRLVAFRNPEAIAQAVIDLFDNEAERHGMRKRAYNFCRKMIWKRVARSYLELFAEAGKAWAQTRRDTAAIPSRKHPELPEVDLRHLRQMTDGTGILQHCQGTTPDRTHGYCTDDNARALIVAAMYWDQTNDPSVLELVQTYLSFLSHAMDEETGRFRNFLSYERRWLEEVGSEDSHGRALWGLGMGVAFLPHESMIALATRLFRRGLPPTERFRSPRAWAFSIIGIHAYLKRFSGDSEVRRYREILAEKLANLFKENMADDWPWGEDTIAYANAKLPHALLMSGKWMQRGDLIDIGKRALDWLIAVETADDGMLSPVGNEGWYPRGGRRAQFAQQPIEAHSLVDACIEAYYVTGEKRWLDEARKAFNWFLGDNDIRTPVFDFTTGGCCDGLHADRISENEGAESTITWLLSLLLMHDLRTTQALGKSRKNEAPAQRPVAEAVKSSGRLIAADTPHARRR